MEPSKAKPPIDQEIWLDARGHQILSINKEQSGRRYALVLLKFPWTTVPFVSEKPPRIGANVNFEVISVDERRKFVQRKLIEKNAEQTFVDYCSYDPAMNENIEEGEIRNLYICFWGAEYLAWLWMGADPKLINRHQPVKEIALEQIRYLRGVYHCEIELVNEDHAFVLDITENEITVYNSYGGTREFFVTTFNREEWIEAFIGFGDLSNQEQYARYHELWGFRHEMIVEALGKNPAHVLISNFRIFQIY